MYEFTKPPIKFDEASYESLRGNSGFPEFLYADDGTSILQNPTESDWDKKESVSIYGFFVHKDYLLDPKGNVDLITSDEAFDGSWHQYGWNWLTECFWITKEDYLALGGRIPEGFEEVMEPYGDIHGKLYEWYKCEDDNFGDGMVAFLPIVTREEQFNDEMVTVIKGGIIPVDVEIEYEDGVLVKSTTRMEPYVYITENDEVKVVWNTLVPNIWTYLISYTDGNSVIRNITREDFETIYSTPIIEFVQAYMESVK